jgi:hypothetical protein
MTPLPYQRRVIYDESGPLLEWGPSEMVDELVVLPSEPNCRVVHGGPE